MGLEEMSMTSDYYITSDRSVKIEILPTDIIDLIDDLYMQGDKLISVSRDHTELIVYVYEEQATILWQSSKVVIKERKKGRFTQIK
jgi:hypothetical protein